MFAAVGTRQTGYQHRDELVGDWRRRNNAEELHADPFGVMTGNSPGTIPDENMFANLWTGIRAHRYAGERQIQDFAANLVTGEACEMGKASVCRFNAIMTAHIALSEEMTVELKCQLISKFFALLRRTRKRHQEAVGLGADNRPLKTAEIVEIDDAASLWLVLEISNDGCIAGRQFLNGARCFLLGGRHIKATNGGNRDTTEAPTFVVGAGDDFCARNLTAGGLGAHARRTIPVLGFQREV